AGGVAGVPGVAVGDAAAAVAAPCIAVAAPTDSATLVIVFRGCCAGATAATHAARVATAAHR
ncbi:MAG: hypothetical protein WKG32_09295, partial [Gemmatimonadaceae bacterium]